jgi:hypothetical protein
MPITDRPVKPDSMGLSLDVLEPPLDDIAYLARSDNRVTVLEALGKQARTRRELHETTGISQPTLGRILGGFEDRAWVRKNGKTYELTRFGELVATDFAQLMDTAEAVQRLRSLEPSLPLDDLDFDIRLLTQGTITTPRPTDASAHFRRERELLEQKADPRVPAELDKLRSDVESLKPEARLPLLDLALPALRELSPEQYDAFRQVVRDLIAADEQVSVFEFCLVEFVEIELPFESLLGLLAVCCLGDQVHDGLGVVDCFQTAFEDVSALFGLVQVVFRAPTDDFPAVVDIVFECLFQREHLWLAVDQREVDNTERGFEMVLQ